MLEREVPCDDDPRYPPVPKTQSTNSLKEAKAAFRVAWDADGWAHGPDHLPPVPKVRTIAFGHAILPASHGNGPAWPHHDAHIHAARSRQPEGATIGCSSRRCRLSISSPAGSVSFWPPRDTRPRYSFPPGLFLALPCSIFGSVI